MNYKQFTPLKEIETIEEYEELDFDRQNMKDDGKYRGHYENFRMGPLIRQARLALGLSQAELAGRSGMKESHISELENNAAESRISTLRKIVELGLGGTLEFTIRI